MLKSLGLGICCLTLCVSGVTRASILPVDGGKYGDDKCLKVVDPCLGDKLPGFDLKGDIKDILGGKGDDKFCDDKHVDDHKDCKVDFKGHEPIFCDGDKDKDHGKLWVDHCDYDPCGHDVCPPPHCEPAAVPAPASAAFGGLGIAGIMLMVGLKARKSVIC